MKTQTLYYKDSRSDKVYTASVDNGTVQFAWGPRGGTMQTKTVAAASETAANALYQSKLNEKLAKGYTPGEDATPLETVGFDAKPEPCGPRLVPKPMLLNEITDAELLSLAPDPDIYFQEKFDGNRIILEKRDGRLTSYSRTGRVNNTLPGTIVKAALECPYEAFIIDGEIIGDIIWAFDLLAGLADMRASRYSDRLGLLHSLFGSSQSGIRVVETATDPDSKLALFARCKSEGREGVVLKYAIAPYTPGRPNSGGPALKYKFVATASVIVAAHNVQSSFNMKLFDGTELGRCTIPPNKTAPPVGAVVEVRYLYAHRSGSLSQSVFLAVREDIEPSECTIDQLKFKGEAK